MAWLTVCNRIFLILFFLCYSYQFFYIAVSLLPRRRKKSAGQTDAAQAVPPHRIAVLIAARNEEAVLGALLDSIAAQDYPADHLRVFVAADNCTDKTAEAALAHGAVCFERSDTEHIGKGYVLEFLTRKIHALYGENAFDAYLVLDADNILESDFVSALDRTYSEGYEAVTCYRNSKNFGDNWISAGYALWFLREARYLNDARMRLGVSCAVSGTGFLFSDRLLRMFGGWRFFLLTEDIEFTAACTVCGVRIGYCREAVLYDEQPTDFMQSWYQRQRWSRGYIQVFGRFGGALLRGIAGGSFSCCDMAMNILPAAILTCGSLLLDLAGAVFGLFSGYGCTAALRCFFGSLGGYLGTLFFIGVITTLTERKQIHIPTGKKILSAVTFPLFMLTYLPICVSSLFCKPCWKAIRHDRCIRLPDIR